MAMCGSKPKSMAKGGVVKKQTPPHKAPKDTQPIPYIKSDMGKKPPMKKGMQ